MLLQSTLTSLRKLPLTCFEADSRKVLPGSIFVCSQGLNHDSHHFVDEAVARGAIGLIATRPVDTRLPCFVMPGHAMSISLISHYYQNPQRQLFNIGVTGTNGKTTVAYSLHKILNQTSPSAYTGTLGCEFDGHQGELINTTPDAITLLNLMKRMVDKGVTHHVMEVSSHALDQDRVSCMDYDITIFTNLGEDHIDYHGSRDDYLQAKLRLADRLKPDGFAIINLDDPMAMAIMDRCQQKSRILTYSTQNPEASLYADPVSASCQGAEFQLHYQGSAYKVSTPLPFQFNVENSLAILAPLLATGQEPEQAINYLKYLSPVPGRCEVISLGNGATAIVDYAHNHDALSGLIRHVRQHTNGHVLTVIGVTGDRLMDAEVIGRCCSQLSDHSFFTTDNPMGLEPDTILASMCRQAISNKITIEANRERAIALALSRFSQQKHSNDVLLVCGKGPETWQYTSIDKLQSEPYAGDKAVIETYARAGGLLL
ncbi:Mur ligase family protein [Endozoicomonas lisbonensis]|uniref:UDP-N-acetylmuramoyl-L-alanyl-D-glutamate--2, 6-diaminopimelate ligase n=1 Tax=Endozoicomonas lisbonensis TaxID=3120522 RepID=A0ABV2SE96_9GAMM